MEHLHLLIPELFLPADIAPAQQPGLRVLETMLARARPLPPAATRDETRLCELLGSVAVAPLRAAGDGLTPAADYWMCADPVALQRQPARVMLLPGLPCELAQAQAFCAALNEHFAADGIRFHTPHAQRWYLSCADASEVQMPTLSAVAWQDVRMQLPQGRDALRWQALGNEIQMLLHGHPLNQARSAAGLPTIDSLWLWGGGRAQTLHGRFDAAGGEEALQVLARGAGLAVPADLSSLLASGAQRALWSVDVLHAALARHDLPGWLAGVQAVQEQVLQPLWQALGEGRLRSLTLESASGPVVRSFAWQPSDRWRVWRRRQPLSAYSV